MAALWKGAFVLRLDFIETTTRLAAGTERAALLNAVNAARVANDVCRIHPWGQILKQIKKKLDPEPTLLQHFARDEVLTVVAHRPRSIPAPFRGQATKESRNNR